jgi:hypothetical protein
MPEKSFFQTEASSILTWRYFLPKEDIATVKGELPTANKKKNGLKMLEINNIMRIY